MRTELVDQRVATLRVAPGKEALGEKLHAHGRAFVLGELTREQRRKPIAAEQPAHRRPGAGLGQEIVLILAEHGMSSFGVYFDGPDGFGTTPLPSLIVWRGDIAKARKAAGC